MEVQHPDNRPLLPLPGEFLFPLSIFLFCFCLFFAHCFSFFFLSVIPFIFMFLLFHLFRFILSTLILSTSAHFFAASFLFVLLIAFLIHHYTVLVGWFLSDLVMDSLIVGLGLIDLLKQNQITASLTFSLFYQT